MNLMVFCPSMKTAKFLLKNENLEELVNYLISSRGFSYENHSPFMSVLIEESFYWRTSSAQLNVVMAKRKEDRIYITAVGGGGGTGVFNISWGAEKSFLRQMRKLLVRYTEAHDIVLLEKDKRQKKWDRLVPKQ